MWKRTPKRGFKNINRVEYTALNIERLQAIVDKHQLTTVNPQTLAEHGIVRKCEKVKILGRGELNSKIEVTAHAFSSSAKEAIEAKGGTVNLV